MKKLTYRKKLYTLYSLMLFFNLALSLGLQAQFNFTPSGLHGATLTNPTSLQFGPDGRLYVSQQNGIIKAFSIVRSATNNYTVTATETINLINQIPNHNDDGTLAPTVTTRQITGILLKGTSAAPVIYVTSSDSRIGGPDGDFNLDTNSGVLSMLVWNGTAWVKTDLVRGFPRSEENHSVNGMQIDDASNMLYMAVGGITNAGSPSINFAYTTEYALSAAIVSVNLTAVNAMSTKGTGNAAYKYDLPTLDDPTRTGNPDLNDPWGGNDGLNQAKIVGGGPVQIFSPGFRNAYDLVITKTPGKAGRIYTVDNGANQGWGGYPENEGPLGNATNNYVSGEPGSNGPGVLEPQVNNLDNLHYIGNLSTYVPGSYYGGHPTPVRANPSGAGLYTVIGTTSVWRTLKTGPNPLPADWPPAPSANPREGDFLLPGAAGSSSLLTFTNSTNGLAEYTASNFNNVLKGSILACGYEGTIWKISFNANGTDVTNSRAASNKLNQDVPFASGFGSIPLDITAQGDADVFPGTVWAATYGSNAVTIFEPQDMVVCTGLDNNLDDDHDGYTNADEIDNNTNPCSGSSKPNDFDQDLVSDLNDTDDDNDGIPDSNDFFAIDPQNGLSTGLPVQYPLLNNNPGTGLFGLGFTGLMIPMLANVNYQTLYNPNNLIAGGAVGVLSVISVPAKDATGNLNNLENGFQFGVKAGINTGPFTVNGRILGPLFNNQTPVNNQSQGIYIGTGDQSNFLKIAVNANGGAGGIQIVYEKGDVPVTTQYPLSGGLAGISTVDLYLAVSPLTGLVQPRYSRNGGPQIDAGPAIQLTGALMNILQGSAALAVGVIATSINATPFNASWDYINITVDPVNFTWTTVAPSNTPKWVGYSVMVNNKMYVISGFDNPQVHTNPKSEVYDPVTNVWTFLADMPFPVTHAGITVGNNNKIYVAGGFLGGLIGDPNSDKLQIYDIASNSWSLGPNLPAKCGGNALVRVGNKLHSFGGLMEDRQTGNPAHYVLNLLNLAAGWTTAAPIPLPRCHAASAFVGGKIYIFGGQTGHDGPYADVNYVQSYDVSTDSWTRLNDMPYVRSHSEPATFVMEGKVYLVGGRSGADNNILSNVTYYNPENDSWTEDIWLPANVKLFGPAAEAIGNQLIVANGGLNDCCSPQTTTRKRDIARVPNLKIGFLPGNMNFSVATGNSASKEAILWTHSGTPSYSINTSSLPAWLSVSPTSGTIDLLGGTEIVVTANATGLLSGTYTATITASATGYPNADMQVTMTVTQSSPKVLYLYGSIPPGEVDMKLSDAGPTGMSQFSQALQEAGFTPVQALDASVVLNSATLNQYKVLILGSNNRRFTASEITAVSAWVNAGGGLVAWSDAAFGWTNGGINSTAGLLSDNDLTAQFGMQFLRDNGSAVLTLNQWLANHYINNFNLNAGITVKGEGVSPIRTTFPAIKLANLPPCCQVLNSLDGPLTPADAALSVATVGSGRVLGYFDRNTFWNAGDGTNIGEVNNKLFAQKIILWVAGLDGNANNQPPVANAGPDKIVSLPVDNIILTGSGTDANGTIITYAWSKVSGSGTIISPALATTAVTGLTQGVSVFQLIVTDNNGAASIADQVSVTVNGPVTTSPVYRLNAGGPQLTTSIGTFAADNFFSPAPGATFSVSNPIGNTTNDALYQTERYATTDNGTFSYSMPVPSGNYIVVLHFAELYWTTAGSRIFDVSLEGTKVLDNYDIFKKAGIYSATTEGFSVSVTDGALNILFSSQLADGGADRPKISAIEVLSSNTSNQIPVANAGADQVLLFPVSTTTLNGSGTDADGTISSYAWTKVSGSGTLTTPNAASTGVTGLTQGVSVFQLIVTDNTGASSIADLINVTVNTSGNVLPVANAGPDQVIVLPVNNTTLSGSGTDADGTITAYAWSKVSGTGTITSINSAITTITGLSQGISVFQLIVTDNAGGASVADQVSITVNSATTSTPVYRINSGGPQVINSIGTFAADAFFSPSPGEVYSVTNPIAGTTNDAIYQTERYATTDYGSFSYAMPVTNGTYIVVLHFSELYWTAIGSRVFDVSMEGNKVLDNYDIFKKAGVFTATTETFSVTVNDGTLNILFDGAQAQGGSDRPKISAIEVLSTTTTPTNQAPVANAGADQVIVLPASSATLLGSGSDADGTVTGFAWTKVSGSGTITTPAAATTTITGLTQGVSVFQLIVTDNLGAQSVADQISITVNATASNQPPVANAGTDKVIVLPTNNTTLTGIGTDPDGTVTGYAWTKVSGSGIITSPAAATTAITGLTQGISVFQLIVTDNLGLASVADQVTITVNPPATTTALYRINAGGPLVTNSIGTFAADVNFSSGLIYSVPNAIAGTTDDAIYQSERYSSTDNGTFSYSMPVAAGTYTVILHFAELYWTTAGSRLFDVSLEGNKVLDNYDIAQKVGAFTATTETFVVSVTDGNLNILFSALIADGGKDRPKISAIEVLGNSGTPVNQAPVANAGTDKTVLFPATSTTLTGTGSDPDGTVSLFSWTKVSGSGTITSPNSSTTTITGLTPGISVFQLIVTDNLGATSPGDQVSVTVSGAVNQLPVANAGPDKVLTLLPATSTTLNGSGTDADGTIASYSWTKVSGSGLIISPTQATTTISGLAQGVSVFQLVVTDNLGATSLGDQVTITVNAPTGGTTLYRINAGGPQVTNSIGNFAADVFFSPSPGSIYSVTTPIAGTTNDAIYQTERYSDTDNGTFSYALPIANGSYTVILHFAEIYWTTAGSRVFDVTLEGTKVLDNYDIVQKAGSFAAKTETFTANVADGTLNILFSATVADGGKDRPKISAIEVLQNGTGTTTVTSNSALPGAALNTQSMMKPVPNPSRDGRYKIILSESFAGTINYQLVSESGAILAKGMKVILSGSSVIDFDFARETANHGAYFLEIIAGKDKKVFKLLRE
jgi:N-acetylneuraminic acid mutarotase